MKEKRLEINGKKFVSDIEACKSGEDVIKLLYETLGRNEEAIKIRLNNLRTGNNVEQLNAMDAGIAKSKAITGGETGRQACTYMAAHRYWKLTGKPISEFKIKMNKYMTERAMENRKLLQQQFAIKSLTE